MHSKAKSFISQYSLVMMISTIFVANAFAASSCDPINQAAQAGAKKETDRVDASDSAIKNAINSTKGCMIDFGAMSGRDISVGGFDISKSLQSYLNKTACDYAAQVQSKVNIPSLLNLPNLPNIPNTPSISNIQNGVQNLSNSVTSQSASAPSVWDRLSSALLGK